MRILLILLLCSLASCVPPIAGNILDPSLGNPQQAQLEYDELYKRALACYNDGDVDCALSYATKAIAAEPSRQGPYNIAGVCYVALGEPNKAKDAFRDLIGMDPQSGEAAVAKMWLERMNHAVPVMMLPFQKAMSSIPSWVVQDSYSALKKNLFKSGIYNVVEARGWNMSQLEACREGRKRQAKYVLIGMLNEYNFDKKTYAPLIRFENRTYYMHDVSAEASLQLYETKKCCIVATQTKRLGVDSHDFGKVNDRQIANMLIDNMMLRLFIDMNTSLLQIGE